MQVSFTALDAFFGLTQAPLRFVYFEGDLIALAKQWPDLEFPGLPYADATRNAPAENLRYCYVCSEGDKTPSYRQLRLRHDPLSKTFFARDGVYPVLRSANANLESSSPELALFESVILVSRYHYSIDLVLPIRVPQDLSAQYQRDLLDLILTSLHPERGFELLMKSGFLARYWPEIACLAEVEHAKDFHPEGDVWRHTMETFSYRKSPDLPLSLALLLHDTGKPEAVSNEGRRFDGHADIGERVARNFLSRLGYPSALAHEVMFLVRYHMMPAALPEIPSFRVEDQLRNPLFPVLLELYRCDELSTFKGPDGYYAACAAYKAWCKNTKNPYRHDDGRKISSGNRRKPAW